MNIHVIMRFALCLSVMVFTCTWAQNDETILVVTSDDVETYWSTVKKVAPVYPMISLRKSEQGCSAVGFIIEPDGTTSNHRTMASFPSNNFDKSSIEAAKQFLYEPSERNKDREVIFTTNTFTFHISRSKKHDEKKRKEVAEICTAAANKALKFAPTGSDA